MVLVGSVGGDGYRGPARDAFLSSLRLYSGEVGQGSVRREYAVNARRLQHLPAGSQYGLAAASSHWG